MAYSTRANCVVHKAWDSANSPDKEFAGFWLVLRLKSGLILRGACYEPGNTMVRMSLWSEDALDYVDTWVQLDEVAACSIEWS